MKKCHFISLQTDEDFGNEEEVESDEEIPLYIASNCSMNRKNSFKPYFRSISGQFECSKMVLDSFNFDLIVFQAF